VESLGGETLEVLKKKFHMESLKKKEKKDPEGSLGGNEEKKVTGHAVEGKPEKKSVTESAKSLQR